jgi:hypothetical protein
MNFLKRVGHLFSDVISSRVRCEARRSRGGVPNVPPRMRVGYTKRATDDLRRVSKESRAFGGSLAAAVETRIREIVVRISERPKVAARVIERPGMHVVPLIRYPYKIF